MNKTIHYNKLVRNKIINIISADNRLPVYHTLTNEAYWQALLVKLVEELEEVKQAQNLQETKEELSDVLEVLIAMANFHNLSLQDIIEESQIKRQHHGGFDEKIFLETVISK